MTIEPVRAPQPPSNVDGEGHIMSKQVVGLIGLGAMGDRQQTRGGLQVVSCANRNREPIGA